MYSQLSTKITNINIFSSESNNSETKKNEQKRAKYTETELIDAICKIKFGEPIKERGRDFFTETKRERGEKENKSFSCR